MVTIKFWLLNTLSQLQVWSECILSQFNNFRHFILVKQSDSIQRDGILSTGYFADLTIVFTKLRWKKQSTHVLKKYQFMLWLHFGLPNFFSSKFNTGAWLEVLTVKMYPKKKKSILGWKYSVSLSLILFGY
jgi:hypothetical protein